MIQRLTMKRDYSSQPCRAHRVQWHVAGAAAHSLEEVTIPVEVRRRKDMDARPVETGILGEVCTVKPDGVDNAGVAGLHLGVVDQIPGIVGGAYTGLACNRDEQLGILQALPKVVRSSADLHTLLTPVSNWQREVVLGIEIAEAAQAHAVTAMWSDGRDQDQGHRQ
jgi:hypothetical protein